MGVTDIRPTPLDYLFRLRNYILEIFLENDDFDINELKEDEEGHDFGNEVECEDFEIIPCKSLSENEELGFEYIAGYIASKMHKIDPTLCFNLNGKMNMNISKTASASFLDEMKKSDILYPSVEWLQEVKEIYSIFDNFHPKNSLKVGQKIVSKLANLLHKKLYSHRKFKVIRALILAFTRKRRDKINKIIEEQKKNKKNGDHTMSLRGRIKVAELSYQ